jgi:hypothetical protein
MYGGQAEKMVENPVGWRPLGKPRSLTSPYSPAPAPVSRNPKIIDLFVTFERQIWQKVWSEDYDWGDWTPLNKQAGDIRSPPLACSWGNDRIDLFVKDFTYHHHQDSRLKHASYDPVHEWSDWEIIEGPNDPECDIVGVCARRNGVVDIMSAYTGDDPHLYWFAAYRVGGGWSGWSPGPLVSSDDVRSGVTLGYLGPNELHILMGNNNNGITQWRRQNADRPNKPEDWKKFLLDTPNNEGFKSSPSVISRTSKSMDIFVLGNDNQFYRKSWALSGGWTNWKPFND